MELRDDIKEQIKKESQRYIAVHGDNEHSDAYEYGATVWAIWKQKAEEMERSLNIILANSMDVHIVEQTARKALESFNDK